MRNTVGDGGLLKKNMAENIFQEKLDHNYVESWGDRGGIGLGDLIYDQIVERYGQQMGVKLNSLSKPNGPVPIDHSQWQVRSVHHQKDNNSLNFVFDRLETVSVGDSLNLNNPWKGRLLSSYAFDEKQVIELGHENGLRSKVLFDGKIHPDLLLNQELPEGSSIGTLNGCSDKCFWNLSFL